MPCFQLPPNVFLRAQRIDPPCIGWFKYLNLRLWPHAQVTFTIPILIENPCCDREDMIWVRIYECSFWKIKEAMHKQARVAWNLQQFFVFILFVHSFCRFITIRGYTISSGSLGSTHRLEFSCHFAWVCQTPVSQREWSFHLWYGPVIHQKFYFRALSFPFSCCSPLLAFVLPNLSVYEICINWEHLASQKDSCVLHFCIIYLIAIISSLSEFSISQCPPFKASVIFFF